MRTDAPTPAAMQQKPKIPKIIKAGMSMPPFACTLLAIDFCPESLYNREEGTSQAV